MTGLESSLSIQELLKSFGACREAIEWAGGSRSLQRMWDECPDPEWLLLCFKGLDFCEDAKLRLFAVVCAGRHELLFPDERCNRILNVAEAVATGKEKESHLQPAFEIGSAIALDASRLLEWSSFRNSAIYCVRDSVREKPWDAARHALKNGQRASTSAARESKWQADELRRFFAPDLPMLIERARRLLENISNRRYSGKTGREAGESPNDTVRQHFEVVGRCIESIHSAVSLNVRGSDFEVLCQRCDANLDGLRIADKVAIRIGLAEMEEDTEVASAIALLLSESNNNQPADSEQAAALLGHESFEICKAAWRGFRLASSRKVEPYLRTLVRKYALTFDSAAAFDILAFHRISIDFDIEEIPKEEVDEISWLLVEGGGRTPGVWTAVKMNLFLGHSSVRVREAVMRASARSAVPELLVACREATARMGLTDAEAISFLGVVGGQEDVARLQATLSNPEVSAAGIAGLGRLGLPSVVPILLGELESEVHGEQAAEAYWRITGQEVPKGEAPGPPEGMSEDELDFWEPTPPILAEQAKAEWESLSKQFDPTKRYQVGLCVSDDPLGEVFDQLPLGIRYDVYLRERALTPGTPDWELETWTWRQKSPKY